MSFMPGAPKAVPVSSPPHFETQRLKLRQTTLEDTSALHEGFSDPETMRFMDKPVAQSLADTARQMAMLQLYLPEWVASWSLVERATGAVMGFVNYHHREVWNSRLEIGFFLCRAYWGQGFMSEAVRPVLDYGFGALDCNRIEVTVNPDNRPAIAMIERFGFVCESGRLRERQRVGTEYRDLVLYGLLRREWRGAQ